MHEVIYHELDKTKLVGQVLSSTGAQITGLNRATLCLELSVPNAERCSDKYTILDFAKVSSKNGAITYSSPLKATVTTDKSGKLCLSGTDAGETYVPILRMAEESLKVITDQADTLEIEGNLEVSVDALASETEPSEDLKAPLAEGIAAAASSAEVVIVPNQVQVKELSYKATGLIRIPEQKKEKVKAKKRALTTAAKTLEVKYTVSLPATTLTAALDTFKSKLGADGGAANAAFATALKTAFTASLKTAGLDTKYKVKSVASVGTVASKKQEKNAGTNSTNTTDTNDVADSTAGGATSSAYGLRLSGISLVGTMMMVIVGLVF
jgi:hypothetical protein